MENNNLVDIYLRVRVNVSDNDLIDLETGKRELSDYIFSGDFAQGTITGVRYKLVKDENKELKDGE